MKKLKLNPRETILIVFLLLLLIGVCYYMLYYVPTQDKVQELNNQAQETDNEIMLAQSQLAIMDKMQGELDVIFEDGNAEKVTQIAPYDNAKVVMTELNGILGQALNYKLSFADPQIGEDGIVRRTVTMNFACSGYRSAKQIINNLCSSQWRCQMKNLSMSADGDVTGSEVTCNATIVFYESTNLS